MISQPERAVVDTNALVSRLLLPDSVPGLAVRKAVDTTQILVSEATLAELASVLSRSKFDAYVSMQDRQEFIRLLLRVAEVISITSTVQACRDPKDDHILEVAVNGGAKLIVTGDKDLLALHPFHAVSILSPADYLKS